MWRYVQLLASGRKWRGIQGDSAQLGGDFIVDANGVVRLAYRSYDPTDRPSVDTLINQLGDLRKDTKKKLAHEAANHSAISRLIFFLFFF